MGHFTRTRAISAFALMFTYLFFAEYLSPFKRVHIPYDLQSYHYSLTDYAFQSLKAQRFPEWDWTIYSGQDFAGNIQAALFYPPTWLLFAANMTRAHVSFQSMQLLVIAHIWLGFILCYAWLRNRNLTALASALGAGVFAYSGYAMLNLQHLGLITAYAWFPLGLWGIDRKSYWKLVLASALCFLAGYPPLWVAFAVCMIVYSLAAKSPVRTAICTAFSLAASLAIAMIQLLPAWEVSSLKVPEQKYGSGVDFTRTLLSLAMPGRDHLYLGVAGLLGLALIIRRRGVREIVPFLALASVSLILVTNPLGIVWSVIRHSEFLAQVCRDWYFLPGLIVALAALAAQGWDDFLSRHGQRGPMKVVLAVALLLAAGVDYKTFGTGKTFNAQPSSGQPYFAPDFFPLIDADVYSRIRADRGYRILLDADGPYVLDLRHYPGLRSPQGFDPLLSSQYVQMLGDSAHFRSDREFDIGLDRARMLNLLGVKYFISYSRDLNSPDFQMIPQSRKAAYKVFEYRNPQLTYGLDPPDSGRVEVTQWTPETRTFQVQSATGGRFALHEQFFPGWSAFIDGRKITLDRWNGAFQSVSLPPGSHQLSFQYRSKGLRIGAWVSLCSLIVACLALLAARVRRKSSAFACAACQRR